MIEALAGIGLFITACIDGTLHGEPKTLCHEFQTRQYTTVTQCEAARDGVVPDWIKDMARVGIDVHVIAVRCGPAEAEGDDI